MGIRLGLSKAWSSRDAILIGGVEHFDSSVRLFGGFLSTFLFHCFPLVMTIEEPHVRGMSSRGAV
jgi:hypothetical protein